MRFHDSFHDTAGICFLRCHGRTEELVESLLLVGRGGVLEMEALWELKHVGAIGTLRS